MVILFRVLVTLHGVLNPPYTGNSQSGVYSLFLTVHLPVVQTFVGMTVLFLHMVIGRMQTANTICNDLVLLDSCDGSDKYPLAIVTKTSFDSCKNNYINASQQSVLTLYNYSTVLHDYIIIILCIKNKIH